VLGRDVELAGQVGDGVSMDALHHHVWCTNRVLLGNIEHEEFGYGDIAVLTKVSHGIDFAFHRLLVDIRPGFADLDRAIGCH
jgi:hypothetical protein